MTAPLDVWNGLRRVAVSGRRRQGVIDCPCSGPITPVEDIAGVLKVSSAVLLEAVHYLRLRLHRWMPKPALCAGQLDMALRELRISPPRPERCACCGRSSPKLVVDHDHRSDRVRGWVCESCNAKIGLYEWRDSHPDDGTRIARYLRGAWRIKPALYSRLNRALPGVTPDQALENLAARNGDGTK